LNDIMALAGSGGRDGTLREEGGEIFFWGGVGSRVMPAHVVE